MLLTQQQNTTGDTEIFYHALHKRITSQSRQFVHKFSQTSGWFDASSPFSFLITIHSTEISSCHYFEVIMGAMASQIRSLTIVYSTVYSGADQRKHQSSVSLAFVQGIHRSLVNSPHKGQWRGTLMFSLIYAWTTGWVNNHGAGDLRRHCVRYDVTVMIWCPVMTCSIIILLGALLTIDT